MKRLSAIILIFTISVLMLVLTGCRIEPDGVEFVDGALKEVYEIDEELPEYIDIKVTYGKKEPSFWQVERKAIDGFDTRTTGIKKLTLNYENGLTAEWEYEVVYSAEHRAINTEARMTLLQAEHPAGIRREVSINSDKEIRAAYFTVNARVEFADKNFSRFEVEPSLGYGYRVFYVNAKTVKVVIFSLEDRGNAPSMGVLCRINLLGTGSNTVYLSDIITSDGINDYNLPMTEEV